MGKHSAGLYPDGSMNRRNFIRVSGAALAGAPCVRTQPARRNVVFILTDDHRYNFIGALEKTSRQAQRAGQIIHRIRQFVKRSEPQRQTSRVRDITDAVIELAGFEMRRRRVTFNAVVANLKEALRRNLDHDRIRVASVYYNSSVDANVVDWAKTIAKTDYALVDRVEAVDPQTVRFTLKSANASFLSKLTVGIAPKHLLAGQDLATAAFNRKPVGTGAFKLEEWAAGQNVTLVANPNYFRGAPKLQKLIWKIIPDSNVLTVQMLNFYRNSLVEEELNLTDLNEVLGEVLAITRNELTGNGIKVHEHIDQGLPKITGSKDKLKQVFLNLVTNAVQSQVTPQLAWVSTLVLS